uniref:Uncharacterized protein n=1 Tax=Timema bartmani TaxID=61472 RepID=A0A7R9FAA0_9NEOP|nr:unnamed protein product [Timema bartmani]
MAYLLVSQVVNHVNKNKIVAFALAASGLTILGMYFVHTTAEVLPLSCIYVALPGMCVSVLSGIVIDIFPTHLSTQEYATVSVASEEEMILVLLAVDLCCPSVLLAVDLCCLSVLLIAVPVVVGFLLVAARGLLLPEVVVVVEVVLLSDVSQGLYLGPSLKLTGYIFLPSTSLTTAGIRLDLFTPYCLAQTAASSVKTRIFSVS